ncbi:hypothetical protein EYZ11_006912 [Aspergillus tanneri]|uniref:Uncharacterized protein n=1 Tax=Aspergillus tanneri TaxID=1220188 RepID=A0A4S3JGH9_9EURO|nr:hypothetical protein EYZ11_006912 [Aspergillus tanneri]
MGAKGQVISAWGAIMEATVGVLFNGSASSIKTQIFIILDQLIAGDGETPPLEGEETSTALQASITKVAFVFAISICRSASEVS